MSKTTEDMDRTYDVCKDERECEELVSIMEKSKVKGIYIDVDASIAKDSPRISVVYGYEKVRRGKQVEPKLRQRAEPLFYSDK